MTDKKGLRIELISSKLRDLKNSLEYVGEFLPSDYKLLDNRKDRNALYKEVENSIQLMIDICAVINSDIVIEMPSDEDNIIDSLGSSGVLSAEMVKKIHLMKGFRNLLAHRYGDVNHMTAFDNIKSGLADFDIFIKEIERFLNNYKGNLAKKTNGKRAGR